MLNFENPELEAKIKAYIASGEYASAEELFIAALASLEHRVYDIEFEEGELAALCREGSDELDRGEGLDLDDVIREIDELQARAERQQGDHRKTPR